MLTDNTVKVAPIIFKSYTSQLVARSVLAAEYIAFYDLVDNDFALRSQVEKTIGRSTPLHLFTDSKSLFDIMSKGSHTREGRVMLDIHAAREKYISQYTSNIGFVSLNNNIAEGLTKHKIQAALLELMRTVMSIPQKKQ